MRRRLGCGLLVVAAAGGFALSACADESERGCADVGLVTKTSGSTPDDAMSAWVASQGGDVADWASGGDRLEHAFHPRTAAAEAMGYLEVSVREMSPGVWQVDGACAR